MTGYQADISCVVCGILSLSPFIRAHVTSRDPMIKLMWNMIL